MKTKFINLNTISIEAETSEERLLIQNFSKNKELVIEGVTINPNFAGIQSINISNKKEQS
jgi:hypothetical protein